MKNVKRILAFVLSVLMVVSCVPGAIFVSAADDGVNAVAEVVDPNAYRNETLLHMYDGAINGATAVTIGQTFGAVFNIGVNRRLKSFSLPLWTYGQNANQIKVEVFSGSRWGDGTELYEYTIVNHTDGQWATVEIPQNIVCSGALWVCLTFTAQAQNGQMISPFSASRSTNGANCVWAGKQNNPFVFDIVTADLPIDTKMYAEVNFTKHTTDPIVEFGLSEYTVGNTSTSKTDFKTPNDRGFLSVEGIREDPYFVIGDVYPDSTQPGKYLGYQLAQVPAHKVDYIVIKYRTTNVQNGTFYATRQDGTPGWGQAGSYVSFDYNPSGEWETLIVDASKVWGSDTESLKKFRFDFCDGDTVDGQHAEMDIAYIRFYSSMEGAQACVDAEKHSIVALPIVIRDYRADGMLFEYNACDSTQYDKFNLGNNGGFALTALIGNTANLLEGQQTTKVQEKFNELIGMDCYVANGADGSMYQPEPSPIEVILNSGAKQDVYGAEIRYDLVEAELGPNGKPVYRQGVVEFIAWYLELLLDVPQIGANGKPNTNFITGETYDELGMDLASYLRNMLKNAQSGSYEATEAKAGVLVGGSGMDHIETYMDAAYFLLHNTFVDNPGYGMTATEYNTLNLIAQTDANGKTRYVFNTAYDDVTYDRIDGIIQNSQLVQKTQRLLGDGSLYYHRGNPQPANCFDPVFGLAYDSDGSSRGEDTYRKILGVYDTDSGKPYYETTNFHYTMEGHAKFVYHYSENLYFTFIGDDDVYLYINGKRVLDLGGTHPISKVTINLNDPELIKACGLEEGGIYDFDFFYMERHGTAANLCIETNIKVVDPAMITEKNAYQNGIEVEYDGYVDGNQPVVYEFSVLNSGELPFQNITLTDNDIGAVLTPDANTPFTLPEGVTAETLTLTKYDKDGNVLVSQKGLTEEQIKAYLTEGLNVGERLTIYGFAYQIPADKWIENTSEARKCFINHLYTTAKVTKEFNGISSEDTLNGSDVHHVHMAEYVFPGIHRYDWGKLNTEMTDGSFIGESIGLTIPKSEILDIVRNTLAAAGDSNPYLDQAVLTITAPSGSTEGGAINKNASIVNGDVFFRTTKAGMETLYVTVTVNGRSYAAIRVDVYVYGVADNVVVIDYNLPVDVNENNLLLNNDVVWLGDNTFDMLDPSVLIQGGATNVAGNYGQFASNGSASIVYTMNKFMNGVDTITVEIKLYEMGMEQTEHYTGVTMTQTIKVVPANVMYYEDDFEDLNYNVTYVKNDFTDGVGNVWAQYETAMKGDHQSADQDMNYGYDPNFAGETGETLTFDPSYIADANVSASVLAELDRLFNGTVEDWEKYNPDVAYPTGTMPGDASNDTIHVMNITHPTNTEIFSFEFVGTGFEIISRTNKDYAVLTVKVEQLQADGSYKTFKIIPVISESVGGDLSQIPLIARKDMPHGQYKVTVNTSNVWGEDRLVFIDGVRVYKPLTDEVGETYYKADEAQVKFNEIKTSIKGMNIVYGTIAEDEETGEYENLWAYGDSMVEDRFGDFVLCGTGTTPDPNGNYMGSYDEYMKYGPNNEIYLSTADGMPLAYIALYIVEDENYVGERSIQVGAHHKYTPDNAYLAGEDYDLSAVGMVYGGKASDITDVNSTYVHTVVSGTEQYFDIDVSCLEFKDDPNNAKAPKKALLIIGTNDSNQNVLALTNLKLNGYSIAVGAGYEVAATQDAGDVLVSEMTAQTYELTKQYAATASKRS